MCRSIHEIHIWHSRDVSFISFPFILRELRQWMMYNFDNPENSKIYTQPQECRLQTINYYFGLILQNFLVGGMVDPPPWAEKDWGGMPLGEGGCIPSCSDYMSTRSSSWTNLCLEEGNSRVELQSILTIRNSTLRIPSLSKHFISMQKAQFQCKIGL